MPGCICLMQLLANAATAGEPRALDRDEVAREFSQRRWQYEQGLPHGNRVYAISQTGDGYLWVATQYGLARFDGRDFTVFDHVNTPELTGSDDCRTLAADREGNLWIGTRRAVIRRSGNRFTSFAEKLSSHLMEFPYPPLCPSRSGGVWVGGDTSICRIQGDKIELFETNRLPQILLSQKLVLDEDDNGFLWIGTTHGLARLEIKNNRYEASETPSVFPNSPVFGIWGEPGGARWILSLDHSLKGDAPHPTSSLVCLEPGQWPKLPPARDYWNQTG